MLEVQHDRVDAVGDRTDSTWSAIPFLAVASAPRRAGIPSVEQPGVARHDPTDPVRWTCRCRAARCTHPSRSSRADDDVLIVAGADSREVVGRHTGGHHGSTTSLGGSADGIRIREPPASTTLRAQNDVCSPDISEVIVPSRPAALIGNQSGPARRQRHEVASPRSNVADDRRSRRLLEQAAVARRLSSSATCRAACRRRRTRDG